MQRSNRYHIGIFGRRNVGKSTLLNALTGQDVSIVSDVAGTTTDTVWKNIELPGIGAAVIGDTAGFDDIGELGTMRNERTKRAAQQIDMALILVNGKPDDISYELQWRDFFKKADIPTIFVMTKVDADFTCTDTLNVSTSATDTDLWKSALNEDIIPVSAKEGRGIDVLLDKMASLYSNDDNLDDITYSLVKAGDVVVLVMPQDASAPKGRLIQPQVVTLRNLLDKHALALCCAPEELPLMLKNLNNPPSLIITDSQVFAQVQALTPKETKLTSFSVLMARHKGDIDTFREAADALMALPKNGKVLIAEACSHIPQNEDIGRVKLPKMLRKKFGEELQIDIVSGNDFPEDLSQYDIIIHCGACMFTRRHVLSRVRRAKAQNIPITNYGIAIAALTGILNKVTI
ncbi:MAG: [FeFe] hydrogenase H-cluster maturation GTPase HydF [Lentimicrobiaceae bacterium]|nr:[FeFe] hydrogenase H-cluster maturation GTPase HydF [Lentimicrobiaceae bacterium]